MCGLKSSLLPAFGQPRGLQGFPEPEMVKLKGEGRMSGEGRAGKSPGEGEAPAEPVSRGTWPRAAALLLTSFFPKLSERSAGKQTGRPHRLAQGTLARFQGCGCPSPYERPRKSCSPHKESMFWNLKDFAATRIQGARATPSRRSRLSQGRGRGLTLEGVGSHAGWLPGGWFLLCPCFVTQGGKAKGL